MQQSRRKQGVATVFGLGALQGQEAVHIALLAGEDLQQVHRAQLAGFAGGRLG
ncbi:hypothetical protein D3C87_2029260 [compost metagenome]